MLFQDRQDAGRQLAQRLTPLGDQSPPPVVLGLPRGGVVVAAEIARELHAPLDVLVVRKLGAPFQPELAIGAVTDGPQPRYILNQDLVSGLGVDDDYLRHEIAQQFEEVKRRQDFYRHGRQAAPIHGRTVIVVDDGIATGATVRAGIAALRQDQPSKIILAVPVAPPETVDILKREVDEVVCLHSPPNFMAVGRFYANFDQTTDEEVIDALDAAAKVAA
jgi:putative phosphoribosyl transferase